MSDNPMRTTTGPRYWRSLDELAESEEFARAVQREFPERASEWLESGAAGRREFLRLMGASLALAGVGGGLSGCGYNDPPEKILPYVRQPERLVLGESLLYATAVSLDGVGTGVLAESHEGRPTMLEGNPDHPDSLGAIDPFTQAALLGLYDPDRSQVVMRGKLISTFDSFLGAAIPALDAQREKQGAGLRVLTTTITSPTLARQMRALRKEFPKATWHQYDPAAPHAEKAGLKLALGRDVSVRRDLAKADVVLAIDSDFLAAGGNRLADARGYGDRRDPGPSKSGMNRLYSVEPTLTITGSSADHRLALKAAEVLPFTLELARRLGLSNIPAAPAAPSGAPSRFFDALVQDLNGRKGRSLVVAGPGQPAYLHALVARINHHLGNEGEGGTVVYAEPIEAEPSDQITSLAALARAMADGSVEVLLILGGNPVYNAPAELRFADGLKKVPFTARLGLYDDETSELCGWHVPEAHELETWGDVRGRDGTTSIQQPLIAPLYDGVSAIELIAAVLRSPGREGLEIVRDAWREKAPAGQDFETFWKTSVHAGVVAGTAAAVVKATPKDDLGPPPAAPAVEGYELVFRPDPTVYDGRFANNGWLQELPKPLTKLTWENAALMSLATAEKLGAADGDLVEIVAEGRRVEAPVVVLPGHAVGSVTLTFGYGRRRAGRVGKAIGYNAFALWTSAAPGFAAGASVRRTGSSVRLATTQAHQAVDWTLQGEAAEERGIVRVGTQAEFARTPDFAQHGEHAHTPGREDTLYTDDVTPRDLAEPDYQWGLTVDLSRCTGCSACVLSCQAENNIPVVGKEQVLRSREMHWMQVDRYYEGDPSEPAVHHQPRMCMHCEKAPCELVCPVAATVHDHEGLNLMVYNRCVGTRYCSNNCPYKVRHFNFLQYADLRNPTLAAVHNPDVSVRARGVMEKCTYCVQRISEARQEAEKRGERIPRDAVKTACQTACPTRAIAFGDTSDPGSTVARLKAGPRNYGMLAMLNTRPRTSYLAKLRNPNPDLEVGSPTEGHGHEH
jgi:molybdopterin-containing oxidoreductase family iron-sulfur binding subunit